LARRRLAFAILQANTLFLMAILVIGADDARVLDHLIEIAATD